MAKGILKGMRIVYIEYLINAHWPYFQTYLKSLNFK